MRLVISFILLTVSVISHAQTISCLMSAGVNYSKLDTDNTYFITPEKISEGYYESVELIEIDNTLVLRCEEGKANEYGFVDENTQRSIMFKISSLTYEWINPVSQEGILFKGICSNKQLGYNLPFIFRLNISGPDMLSVGHNVKTLGEIRNYNLNRLFEIGDEVVKKGSPTSKTDYNQKIIKKNKPKLTK